MAGRVLIVHPPTMGLRHDRLVLGQAIAACDPAVTVTFFEMPVAGHQDYSTPLAIPPWAGMPPFDCVFLLEEARSNPPLFDRRFARRVAFVPNVEWILPVDEASLAGHAVDFILLKNDHARQCLAVTELRRFLPLMHVVGWTSFDSGEGGAWEGPVGKTALHLAGRSRQKGTGALLDAWLGCPSWPTLTVGRQVLPDPTAFRRPIPLAPNVMLQLGSIEYAQVQAMQAAHGIHVYPSRAEGFGHALNEARALGRVLVTSDAPPMRDLVEDGVTGGLIAVDPADIQALPYGAVYPVSAGAVRDGVAAVLDRDPAALQAMGRRARAAYLRDRARFHRAFAQVWRDVR